MLCYGKERPYCEGVIAVRLVSWNVNGIRSAIRNGFMDWLESEQSDIICLQEVRALPGDLTPTIREPRGYTSFWQPAIRKGYSGVATYTKVPPVSVAVLGLEEFDAEGRVQALEYPDFTLINTYFPNSQPERARIDYKLAFCAAIQTFCNRLRDTGKHIILCGDYNIAHTEIDLARPKENVDNPGFLPEERAAMTAFLAEGYVDTFRHFCDDPGHYSWWSYRGRAREKNIGWRLDYHCVDAAFISHVKEARICSEVAGSDHCPVSITIK